MEFQIVDTVVKVNKEQREHCLQKIIKMLDGNVAGKTIGILGVSFKPETDDIREAPALDIVQQLLDLGGAVRAPIRLRWENFAKLFPQGDVLCGSVSKWRKGATFSFL